MCIPGESVVGALGDPRCHPPVPTPLLSPTLAAAPSQAAVETTPLTEAQDSESTVQPEELYPPGSFLGATAPPAEEQYGEPEGEGWDVRWAYGSPHWHWQAASTDPRIAGFEFGCQGIEGHSRDDAGEYDAAAAAPVDGSYWQGYGGYPQADMASDCGEGGVASPVGVPLTGEHWTGYPEMPLSYPAGDPISCAVPTAPPSLGAYVTPYPGVDGRANAASGVGVPSATPSNLASPHAGGAGSAGPGREVGLRAVGGLLAARGSYGEDRYRVGREVRHGGRQVVASSSAVVSGGVLPHRTRDGTTGGGRGGTSGASGGSDWDTTRGCGKTDGGTWWDTSHTTNSGGAAGGKGGTSRGSEWDTTSTGRSGTMEGMCSGDTGWSPAPSGGVGEPSMGAYSGAGRPGASRGATGGGGERGAGALGVGGGVYGGAHLGGHGHHAGAAYSSGSCSPGGAAGYSGSGGHGPSPSGGCRLYVASLPFNATSSDLRRLFGGFGCVTASHPVDSGG